MDNSLHSRFSSLDWYGDFRKITIIGLGSIGSWTALFLAKMGHDLFAYDPDEVEKANLAGQFYKMSDCGVHKAVALSNTLSYDYGIVMRNGSFNDAAFDHNSVCHSTDAIVATDNMRARHNAYDSWQSSTRYLGRKGIFIDGRLNPEHFQIFTVQYDPNDIVSSRKNMEFYEQNLFDDSEVPDLPCSAKYTTHSAAMIASMIASIYSNYVVNMNAKEEIRDVPRKTEMTIPMMMLEIE